MYCSSTMLEGAGRAAALAVMLVRGSRVYAAEGSSVMMTSGRVVASWVSAGGCAVASRGWARLIISTAMIRPEGICADIAPPFSGWRRGRRQTHEERHVVFTATADLYDLPNNPTRKGSLGRRVRAGAPPRRATA